MKSYNGLSIDYNINSWTKTDCQIDGQFANTPAVKFRCLNTGYYFEDWNWIKFSKGQMRTGKVHLSKQWIEVCLHLDSLIRRWNLENAIIICDETIKKLKNGCLRVPVLGRSLWLKLHNFISLALSGVKLRPWHWNECCWNGSVTIDAQQLLCKNLWGVIGVLYFESSVLIGSSWYSPWQYSLSLVIPVWIIWWSASIQQADIASNTPPCWLEP